MSKSFTCLYTKHKTQKRKKWNDGKLIVQHSGLVHLHACANNTNITTTSMVLDTLAITTDQAQMVMNGSIIELEMETHLIEIEGEYSTTITTTATSSNSGNSNHNNGTTIITSSSSIAPNLVKKRKTNGMQKLLTNKFKKPTKYIPPPPNHDHRNMNMNNSASTNAMHKKKRPFQPGEYLRQLHDERYPNDANRNRNTHRNNPHPQQYGQIDHSRGQGHISMQQQEKSSHSHWGGNGIDHSNNYQQQQHQQYPVAANHRATNHGNHPNRVTPTVHAHAHSTSSASTSAFIRPLAGQSQGSLQTSAAQNQFVANDFDPNSFYEEEEDDEGESGAYTNTGVGTDASSVFQQQHHGGDQEYRTAQAQMQMQEQARVAQSGASENWNDPTSDQHQNTMTNSDLLELFNVRSGPVAGKEIDASMHANVNGPVRHHEADAYTSTVPVQAEDDEVPKAPNSFLDRLLRSDQELDQNAKVGSAVVDDMDNATSSFHYSWSQQDNDDRADGYGDDGNTDDDNNDEHLPCGDSHNIEGIKNDNSTNANTDEGISKGESKKQDDANNDAPFSFDIELELADVDSESSDEEE